MHPVNGPTGDDVQAVQKAINMEDQSSIGTGEVVLSGTLDFDSRTVQVNPQNRPIIIRGDATVANTINNGGGALDSNSKPQAAFDVISSAQPVTIQGLHFVSPKPSAIRVLALKDLKITNCTIDGVSSAHILPDQMNLEEFWSATGIVVNLAAQVSPARLVISDNKMTIGSGTSDKNLGIDRTLGIAILAAVSSSVEVDITITGNRVSTVTARGIDFRGITGKALIQGNKIAMGDQGVVRQGVPFQVCGIRCQSSGDYRVMGNSINCGFTNAAGIRLEEVKKASADNNGITMSFQDTPGDLNAGIYLNGGKCLDNGILDNIVSGTSRAGIFVGEGVTNTWISSFFDSPRIPSIITIIDEGLHTTMLGAFTVIRTGVEM